MTVGNLYPPQHLGGYELMWEAVVGGLRSAGHDVSVLTTATRFREAPDPPGVERSLRWYWRDHRWPRMAPWTVRAIERHNERVFARATVGADLVSFWSMGGLSLSLLSSFTPALAVVHDDWPLYGPKVDKAFRGSEVSLPPAVWVSEFTRRGRPGEVVSSGYDERVFRPAEPREWSGQLLLPGRIDRRKGHATALATIERLPTARLTVAGGGDEAFLAELRAAAGERVRFTGQLSLEELAAEYAACDAVLFPVEWDEPWGLVPLEAMAVGRPVLATGRGGSAEYLRDGENCLLVPAGDPDALAAAVRRLAGDEPLRAKLRAGGFATAANHTLSRFVERMVGIHEHAAFAGGESRGRDRPEGDSPYAPRR